MLVSLEYKSNGQTIQVFPEDAKAHLPVSFLDKKIYWFSWRQKAKSQVQSDVFIHASGFKMKTPEKGLVWFDVPEGAYLKAKLNTLDAQNPKVRYVTLELLASGFPKVVDQNGNLRSPVSREDALPQKGRGSNINPVGRFESISVVKEVLEATPTQYIYENAKSILTTNDSPDVGIEASVNPYRGCEHGCSYCYARPTHEYMGLSAGLDFESKIFAKINAPQLLREELSSKKWTPKTVTMSGVTDCYQPLERQLKLTRQCLEVLCEFKNPAVIVTKNHLVTRDVDVLVKMAAYRGICVYISVTSLDGELAGKLEPRASRPEARLAAIHLLSQAGIPVGVMVAPILPGLTDHEIPAILKAAKEAGAQHAGHVVLRLPFGVKAVFESWLTEHYPQRKEKVLNRILSVRSGKLNDSSFTSRMRGEGEFAEQIHSLFALHAKKLGFNGARVGLSTEHFERPLATKNQLSLF